MFDKPISLSVKDFLIRKMAVKLMLDETIIDAVISHQFISANEALTNNKSIEISGFGKFYFNQKKANKRMNKLQEDRERIEEALKKENTEQAADLNVSLIRTNKDILILKPKMNE